MKTIGTLVLSLAAVSAQAATLPGVVLIARTPHVSFFTRGARVDSDCIERRIADLEVLFGQPLGRPVAYYRYATAQELAARTGHYAAGVTFASAGEVHSTEACHDHELVHLVAGPLGDPGPLFQEGLAVAVGNHGRWRGHAVDKLARGVRAGDLVSMMATFEDADPRVAYPAAGSFVGHLIRAGGLGRVIAFFRACPPGADREAAFARCFGRTFAVAAAEWRAGL